MASLRGKATRCGGFFHLHSFAALAGAGMGGFLALLLAASIVSEQDLFASEVPHIRVRLWGNPTTIGKFGLEAFGISLESILHGQSGPFLPSWMPLFLGALAVLLTAVLSWWLAARVSSRRFQDALARRMRELDRFFELNLALLCVMRPDGCFVRINPEWERALGHKAEEMTNRHLFDFVHPDDLEATRRVFEDLASGKAVLNFLNRYRDKSGGYRYLEWRAVPEETLIYAAARDVTPHIEALQLWSESEARWRTIVEKDPQCVNLLDREGRILEMNPSGLEMMQATSLKQIRGKQARGFIVEEDRAAFDEVVAAVYRGEERRRVFGIVGVGGRLRILETTSVPLREGGPGTPVSVLLCVAQDITERKRSEEAVVSALREKETLLKEIHHRVKNNLQIISSLLSLQARSLPEAADADPLMESQGRVRAMALVHEMLYRSSDLARVDAGAFVRELVAALLQTSFGLSDQPQIVLDVEPILLDTDRMVPLGLLLNELLTNAFKYGRKPGEPGKMRVTLRRETAQEIRLSVADLGGGISEEAVRGGSQTLGMRLVHSLADQLQGFLRFERVGGTTATFIFPCPAEVDGLPGGVAP